MILTESDIPENLCQGLNLDLFMTCTLSTLISSIRRLRKLACDVEMITQRINNNNDLLKESIIKYLSQNRIDPDRLPDFTCKIDEQKRMCKIDNQDILQLLFHCVEGNQESEFIQKHQEYYPDIKLNITVDVPLIVQQSQRVLQESRPARKKARKNGGSESSDSETEVEGK
jgi:hypothetical protein